MTVAPLPLRRGQDPRAPMPMRPVRRPPGPAETRLARRRWTVAVAKRLLPVVALALLSAVALWPELSRDADRSRLAYRRGGVEPQSGQMSLASYHGVDERGRPYTMTATTANQVSPERINLVAPKGDMTLESGGWLMVEARKGVYLQHAGSLDLSDEVQLYRDDGTTMQTSAATLDLKAGAAVGADQVHVEGPFGTLDAQGFAMTDRGTVMRFSGPGRMVLNAAQNTGPAAGKAPPAAPHAP